ncbi:MAG: hypothetical protein H6713_42745, partial [Myxococcales bacterium]|nr:hypothetical protein [Myxococcales bacterium]
MQRLSVTHHLVSAVVLVGLGVTPTRARADGPAGRPANAGLVTPGHGIQAPICADGPTIDGIDVSAWQGDINWGAVASSGIEFAFVRVSDGLLYSDSYFDDNWAESRANGIATGVYQFFRPSQDPVQQAQLLLDKMGPLGPGDLPPAIDVETGEGLSQAQVAAAVGAWIGHVEAALGVKPVVYTGKYIWQSAVGSDAWSSYPLWLAQYDVTCPDPPTQWSEWAIHQTSSSGSVSGIAGSVDTNVFNGTLAELLELNPGMATCGDNSCSPGETPDSCPADCPPCGVIPPTGAIIDNPDACFVAHGNPQYWYPEAQGQGGDLIWTHAIDTPNPDNFVTWELFFAKPGLYRVEVHIDAVFGLSKLASYQVHYDGQFANVPVDQSSVDGWYTLGDYTFREGGAGQRVQLNDNTGEPYSDMIPIAF